MCGIVGLLVKKREQRPALGRLAVPMFTCMGERGPDSGGLAVFGTPLAESQRRVQFVRPQPPRTTGRCCWPPSARPSTAAAVRTPN